MKTKKDNDFFKKLFEQLTLFIEKQNVKIKFVDNMPSKFGGGIAIYNINNKIRLIALDTTINDYFKLCQILTHAFYQLETKKGLERFTDYADLQK